MPNSENLNAKRQKLDSNNSSTNSSITVDLDIPRYKFDVGNFIHKNLSDDEKYELLKNVYVPENSYSFPSTRFGDKNRSFQYNWLNKYPGLAYSPSMDGAF